MHSKQTLRFFISANSGEGFYSLYDSVFQNEKFDKIYVIHGGPGTGKSTLMHRISESAKQVGAECQEIICSSDPDSLDGLILNFDQKKIGVLDGTAPHPRIISAPGATEVLWNLGDYWDEEKLEKAKHEIFNENKKKRRAYHSAYTLLHAAESCHAEIKHMLLENFDIEKAESQIQRSMHKLSQKGETDKRFFRAFSMKGEAMVKEAFDITQKQILLCGEKHAAEIYLSLFSVFLKKENIKHTLFLSPLYANEADGIYINETKTAYIWETHAIANKESKKMHMKRFMKNESKNADLSRTLHRISTLEKSLTDAALHSLYRAGKNHFALENIYQNCMNFKKLQTKSDILIEEILSTFKK